jgi:hypothetical protein
MSAAMDEQQMLLIMKYYDGECSEVEVLHAERLLREGDKVGSVMEKFSALGGMVEEWGHTVQSRTTWVPDIDAIMKEVEARHRSSTLRVSVPDLDLATSGGRDAQLEMASQSSKGLAGASSFFGRLQEKKESRSPACGMTGFDFWHGLGWASSGALVAASLVLLFGISGKLSYFDRSGGVEGADNAQSASAKVVSGEGLITGGDKGVAGTSFVNEQSHSSRLSQPLLRPWDHGKGDQNKEINSEDENSEGLTTSLAEMKEAKKEKRQRDQG